MQHVRAMRTLHPSEGPLTLVDRRHQFGGFGATTHPGMPGGYTYRHNDDGSYTITAGPKNVDTTYRSGPVWEAINAQVVAAGGGGGSVKGPGPGTRGGRTTTTAGGKLSPMEWITGITTAITPLIPVIAEAAHIGKGKNRTMDDLYAQMNATYDPLERAQIQQQIAAYQQAQQSITRQPVVQGDGLMIQQQAGAPTWLYAAGAGAVVLVLGAILLK